MWQNTCQNLAGQEFIQDRKDSWQAHLVRISPFLVAGEVWWNETEGGYEFFDGEDDSNTHSNDGFTLHFREHTVGDVEHRRDACWSKILREKILLPAEEIKVYDREGNSIGKMHYKNGTTTFSPLLSGGSEEPTSPFLDWFSEQEQMTPGSGGQTTVPSSCTFSPSAGHSLVDRPHLRVALTLVTSLSLSSGQATPQSRSRSSGQATSLSLSLVDRTPLTDSLVDRPHLSGQATPHRLASGQDTPHRLASGQDTPHRLASGQDTPHPLASGQDTPHSLSDEQATIGSSWLTGPLTLDVVGEYSGSTQCTATGNTRNM